MNRVQISEFNLSHPNGRKDRVAIFKCSIYEDNPKAILDEVVNLYVGLNSYNEFVETSLKNPWVRVIINDINELNYKKYRQYRDVEIYESILISKKADTNGKIAVIRGGLNSEKPILFMNEIVQEYVDKKEYKEFVEIYLDNPWVRIIFFDFDLIKYEPFINQTIHVSI